MILLILSACLSEDTYMDRLDSAVCDWKARCWGDDKAVCIDAAAAGRTEHDCDYDPEAAQDCLDGIQEMACPDETAEDVAFPYWCDEVWSC